MRGRETTALSQIRWEEWLVAVWWPYGGRIWGREAATRRAPAVLLGDSDAGADLGRAVEGVWAVWVEVVVGGALGDGGRARAGPWRRRLEVMTGAGRRVGSGGAGLGHAEVGGAALGRGHGASAGGRRSYVWRWGRWLGWSWGGGGGCGVERGCAGV